MHIDQAKVYTDEDIENAMATVARVIELYGDAYWPILERLERELTERRARAARLTAHLRRFQNRPKNLPTARVGEKPVAAFRKLA